MSNQEFTKVILDKMHDVLKPSGFRKQGSTFVKECGDDVVLEVNLQKNTSSTSTGLRATVNLRVYSRTLTRAMGCSMDYPTDPDRHWQERIGKLMPEQSDRWWTVETSQTAVQAGKRLPMRCSASGCLLWTKYHPLKSSEPCGYARETSRTTWRPSPIPNGGKQSRKGGCRQR